MKRISFNSIVVPNMGSHQLAFLELKSYLFHKGMDRHFEFVMNCFDNIEDSPLVAEKILEQNPEIVAFSVFVWNELIVRDVCGHIKQKRPDILILLGGSSATFRAAELMAEGAADIIVKGAGENVLYRLLDQVRHDDYDFSVIPNLVYKRDGRVVATDGQDHFDVSSANYPLLIEEETNETFYYETSRGCPFHCRYCAWPTQSKMMTFYPREKIEADLKRIFELRNVMCVVLCDSDIFNNKEHGLWLLAFFQQLNETRKNMGMAPLKLAFETNPQHFDVGIIEAILSSINLFQFIMFGLQSADERVNRDYIRRDFNRKKYILNMRLFLSKAKEKGIHRKVVRIIFIELIYGLPGDSHEGCQRSLDVILSEFEGCNFHCYPLQVLPGTYFWNHSEDFGLVFEDNPPHRLISNTTYSQEDMQKTERLVFFMIIFSHSLKGVMRFIDRKMSGSRIHIYERLMDHISSRHPEFVAMLTGMYNSDDDIRSIFNIRAFQANEANMLLRNKIVAEAREIVEQAIK